jgi:hypothetical protein
VQGGVPRVHRRLSTGELTIRSETATRDARSQRTPARAGRITGMLK